MNATLIRRSIIAAVCVLGLSAFPGGALGQRAPEPAAHAARATVATFAGQWTGHTRELTILRSGKAHESVGDGCCDELIKLDLQLSHPRGMSRRATARVRVVKVQILDPEAFTGALKAPRVGSVGTLRLRDGVIHEPFIRATYCDRAAGMRGTCGA
jgi:hypothetical protein